MDGMCLSVGMYFTSVSTPPRLRSIRRTLPRTHTREPWHTQKTNTKYVTVIVSSNKVRGMEIEAITSVFYYTFLCFLKLLKKF